MTTERRKVLFLLPSLEGGGAERMFVTLLRHFNREMFELHLGLLRASGPYLADLPSDVSVHTMGVRRVRHAIPSIVRLVRRIRPRVVVSTPVNLNLIVAASKPFWPRGVRLVIMESIALGAFLDEEMRRPGLWRLLYRSLYRRVDYVVSLCEAMSRDLLTSFNVPSRKMIQIHNPVDFDRLHQLSSGVSNPYETAGPNLIAVGRLENQKGFDLLLDAMVLVSHSCPGARLTILGEGPLRGRLEQQTNQLGLGQSVRLLGFQENPFRYYSWADLFVLVSKYEGLPNVMLEAIALGTPTVATDCPGGVREVTEMFPELAVLCERCPSGVAEKILMLWKEKPKREVCIGAIRTRFKSKFDVGAIVEKYEELFAAC